MTIHISFEFHVHIHRGKERVNPAEKQNGVLTASEFHQKALQEAERLRDQKAPSTVENYLTALRSFGTFLAGLTGDMPFCQDLLKRYEHWLHERQLKPNTSSCYMRSLCSLASKMLGDDGRRMFGEVYTGRAATDKRSLPVSDLSALRALHLAAGSFLALARDLFLFSFYALGMPFVDMAYLRRQQIADGQITYYRHKTGQQITMKIEPCMQQIIDRYANPSSEYVFPILTSTDPKQARREYQQQLNHYNRSLKRLARKAGITHRLTSYVARHTWASTAYSHNVEMPVISKALGHANPRHTQVYIRQLDNSRLYDANHQLLESFLYENKCHRHA